MADKSRIRAVVIDPSVPAVREAFLAPGFEGLGEAVGGSIEIAHEFPNGDVLYVDGDGLGKAEDAMSGREEASRAFLFDIGAHQPFAGKGVIVGAEGPDGTHTDALTLPDDIVPSISFMAPVAATAGDEGLPN